MFVKVDQNDSTVFVEIEDDISLEKIGDKLDSIITERKEKRNKTRGNALLSSIDTSNADFSFIEHPPELPEEKHNKGPHSDFASVDKFIVYKTGTIETHEHFL